jgi:hypothetical protein
LPSNLQETDYLNNDFRQTSRIKSDDLQFIEEFTYHFNLKRIKREKGENVDRTNEDQNESERIKGELNEIIKRICSLLNIDIKMIMKDVELLKCFSEEVADAINKHLIMFHLKNEITEEDLLQNKYGYSKPDFRAAKFKNLPVKIISKSGKINLHLFYFKLLNNYKKTFRYSTSIESKAAIEKKQP